MLRPARKITTCGPIWDPIRQKKARHIVLSLELTKPWSLVDTRRTLMILAMVNIILTKEARENITLTSLLFWQAIQSVYNVTTKLKEVTLEVVVKATERRENVPVSRTFWHLVAMANGPEWRSPRIVRAKMVRISFLSSFSYFRRRWRSDATTFPTLYYIFSEKKKDTKYIFQEIWCCLFFFCCQGILSKRWANFLWFSTRRKYFSW